MMCILSQRSRVVELYKTEALKSMSYGLTYSKPGLHFNNKSNENMNQTWTMKFSPMFLVADWQTSFPLKKIRTNSFVFDKAWFNKIKRGLVICGFILNVESFTSCYFFEPDPPGDGWALGCREQGRCFEWPPESAGKQYFRDFDEKRENEQRQLLWSSWISGAAYHTQQPQVQIPAQARFFFFTA